MDLLECELLECELLECELLECELLECVLLECELLELLMQGKAWTGLLPLLWPDSFSDRSGEK